MQHTPLSSSMINSAGWENNVLEIEFSTGKRYQYQATQDVFDRLVRSSSPGSFFHSTIKGKLPLATVTTQSVPDSPESPVMSLQNDTPPPRSTDYPTMPNEEEIDI